MNVKRILNYILLFVAAIAIATQGFTKISFDGLLIPFLVILAYFTILFIVAQFLKNNSIVDMHWGLGFVVGSWLTLWVTEDPTFLSYAIVALITVWGGRLSVALIKRNYGKPEDFRYAQWREEWGENVVIIAFFRVFMTQGLINFIVGSAPYSVIRYNEFSFDDPHRFLVYIALFVSLVGLFFEIVVSYWLYDYINIIISGVFTPIGLSAFPVSLLAAGAIFAIEWYACYWLYKKKIFFKL